MAATYIGASGWNYAHWRGPFYESSVTGEQMLARYAEHLASVEVNSTFYGLPDADSVSTWVRQTPEHFTFAVKASRYITHMKKLKDPEEPVTKFLEAIRPFGAKLGPVLLQLPPSWKPNPRRLDDALACFPKSLRLAVEFRDTRWIHITHHDDKDASSKRHAAEDAEATQAVEDVLRRHNAAFCVYELAGYRTPWRVTADFGYVRMHGPTHEPYKGRYTREQLRVMAKHLQEWRAKGMDCFCYFDNDDSAFAPLNAVELQELVR